MLFRLDQLSAPLSGIAVWGDSTTRGATATSVNERVTSQLAQVSGRIVSNCGIGSRPPAAIIRSFLGMPPRMHGWTHILFYGRVSNDTDAETVISAIEKAARHPAWGRTIITTPITGGYSDDFNPGGSMYPERVLVRDHVLAEYPDQTIDLHQILIDANDGSAGDLEDVANDVTPRSLRSDAIHHSDAGQLLIAQSFYDAIFARRW